VLNATEDAHLKDMSTFEVDEHLHLRDGLSMLGARAILRASPIKEVYVYVALYVSGFHPRVCPNAK
jgi:hypothetical protein